uniref:Uncharacterized protein n=1 Tax=Anguilla anguilla TaxID=7936 RepID=A0A0E9Q7D8_ANGAN
MENCTSTACGQLTFVLNGDLQVDANVTLFFSSQTRVSSTTL